MFRDRKGDKEGGKRAERERGEGKTRAARAVAVKRYAGRESYINYSDVICMLMGYICMSSRK